MKSTAEIIQEFFKKYEPFTYDELEWAAQERDELLVEGKTIADFDEGYLKIWSCGRWRKIEKIQTGLTDFIKNNPLTEDGEEESYND